MSVLLPTDDLALYPPGAADEHGWVTGPAAGTEPAWAGRGAVQLGPGTVDPRATERGGHGPFDPASVPAGMAYLPADAPAADGMVLTARNASYVLAQTRLVVDPTGTGELDCLAASITAIPAPAPEPEPAR